MAIEGGKGTGDCSEDVALSEAGCEISGHVI